MHTGADLVRARLVEHDLADVDPLQCIAPRLELRTVGRDGTREAERAVVQAEVLDPHLHRMGHLYCAENMQNAENTNALQIAKPVAIHCGK